MNNAAKFLGVSNLEYAANHKEPIEAMIEVYRDRSTRVILVKILSEPERLREGVLESLGLQR